MTIILTRIQFLHIAGYLQRHGYHALTAGFPIGYIEINQHIEDMPGYADRGSIVYTITINSTNISIDELIEFAQRLKNI